MASKVLDERSAAAAKLGFTTISTAIWPILLIASLGMLTIGGAVAIATRIIIERQTEQWIEKSIRTSGSTHALLLDRFFLEAKAIAQQISSRVMIRQYGTQFVRGAIDRTILEKAVRSDLEAAIHEAPGIIGITLFDLQGDEILSIGKAPSSLNAIKSGDGIVLEPMLAGGVPVIPVRMNIRDEDGTIIIHEVVFYRMAPISAAYERDLGAGLQLGKRLAVLVEGKVYWVFSPGLMPDDPNTTALEDILKTSPPNHTVIQRRSDGAIANLVMPSALHNVFIVLTVDAEILATYKSRETHSITIAVCAFVAFGTIVMFFLLRPTAIRIVKQVKDHERAIAELQRSEEFNHRITASTPDCIMTLDRLGHVLSVNRYGLNILEWGRLEEVLGIEWLLLWSNEDKSKALAAVNMAVLNKTNRFQGSTLTSKGQTKWWDVATAPMLDANGQVERVLAVWRDITEEKATLKLLATNEERLRFVASATNDAIWDWSCVNGSLWCNEGVEVIFGYPRSEVGKDIKWLHEHIHPEDHERIQRSIGSAIASTVIAWKDEYRFRCADGSYKQVLDRGYIMRDHYGNALRMIGAMFDLSERRKAEELVRRLARHAILRADISSLMVNTAQQRVLLQGCCEAIHRHLENSFVRIWLLDPASQTLELQAGSGVNPALDRTYAQVPMGTTKVGAIAKERAPQLVDRLIGDLGMAEQDLMLKEGLACFAGYPLLAGDVLLGILGIFAKRTLETDTYDALASIADLIAQGSRKAALELEISRQTKILLKTNAELEQFTYVASHDIQEPLRTITNYLTILDNRYRPKLDEKGVRYIDFAVSAAKRLQSLIKDLLEYSKADRHELFPLEPFSAKTILLEVVSSLESAITLAQATVEVGDLPDIRYNRTQFSQLMQNLIENSIKYRSTSPPHITISAQHESAEWVFSVKDNGIGIDPSYFERIFEVFQRLHGQEVFQGTGIGLALCKKIVIAHGGRIWVESELGHGSTFHFTIPD